LLVKQMEHTLPDLKTSDPRYIYIIQPLPSDTNLHMKITATQIIRGMKGKTRFAPTNSRKTLEAIPRHIFEARQAQLYPNGGAGWRQYDIAWGISTVQGLAAWKILVVVGLLVMAGLIFFISWLLLVNKTDLQNASVPLVMLVGVAGTVLIIAQFAAA